MSSKFLAKKEPIEVSVDYIEFGDQVLVIGNPEVKEKLLDKIKTVKARFARTNYNLYNTIMNASIRPTEEGTTYLNPVLFKTNKFRYLFMEMTDYTGEVIPNSRELLVNIDEDLAIALVDAYDRKINDERFNSLKVAGVLTEDIIQRGERLMEGIWGEKIDAVPASEQTAKKEPEGSPESELPSA